MNRFNKILNTILEAEYTDLPPVDDPYDTGGDVDDSIDIDTVPAIDEPTMTEPLKPPEVVKEPEEWVRERPKNPGDALYRKSENFLRIRRMSYDDSRWLAQLYDKDGIISKGIVNVPKATVDPIQFIKDKADEVLEKSKF